MSVNPHRNTKGPGQPKVSQLDFALGIDEQVLGLEVTMQHPVGVAEGQTLQQLEQIALKSREN